MLFWIVAGTLSALVAAMLARPLLAHGHAAAEGSPDVAIYRDQLAEVDRDLRRGCLHWLLRRPRPDAPAGRSFSYLERGSYGTAVAIVLFSTFIELPIHALVLPFLVHDPAALTLIHLAMLAGVLSTLTWVFGDRWLVVEKILAAGETLPADWPVDGTTGYEHARVLEQTMLDPEGLDHLRRRWEAWVGDDRPYAAWEAAH